MIWRVGILVALLSLALCIVGPTAMATGEQDIHLYSRQREIVLHGRNIDTRHESEFHKHAAFTALSKKIGNDEHNHLFLVHFMTPYSASHERIVREDTGAVFIGYMPQNTWLMEGTEEEARKVQAHFQVEWVGPFLPEDRLPADLLFAGHDALGPHKEGALRVILTPRGKAKQSSVAALWTDVLRSTYGDSIEIKEFDGVFQVFFDPEQVDMTSLALDLAEREYVHWIEPEYLYERHNAWAHGIAQSGVGGVTGETIFGRGFRGAGETIVLGDTGLNMDSCYLRDNGGTTPFDRIDRSERKVISYVTTYGDRSETDPPHGTPVASVLVGSSDSGTSEFNGGAPDAQLYFIDLNDGLSSTYAVPPNPDQSLFSLGSSDDVGAAIQVYPWGRRQTSYSDLDRAVDSYAHSGDRRFLGVFAVGNEGKGQIISSTGQAADEGRQAINAAKSDTWARFVTNERGRPMPDVSPINSPAASKNALGVGSINNDVQSLLQEPQFSQRMSAKAASWRALACDGNDATLYNRYAFCASLGFTEVDTFPCNQARGDFCDRFDGSAASCCQFDYLKSTCCPDEVRANIARFPLAFGEEALSSFSSNGPSYDGRYKPDVVAPGHFVFSSTGNDCEVDGYSGTSYSAAVAGAAAALVRQYLRAGSYVNPLTDVAVDDPSGALIKAMLVNSGQPVSVVNTDDLANLETLNDQLPNYRHGFGRIQLDRVLRSGGSDYNMILFDEVDFQIYQNETINVLPRPISQRFCITIPENSRYVKATMAYFDEAATLGSGVSIVNNLDLVIQDNEGYEYRSNNFNELDARNTVEQVYMQNPPAGEYHILVHPSLLVSEDSDIRFALVVTGDFTWDEDNCQPEFQCPYACSNRGSCTDGRCICSPPFGGPDCSLTPCGFGCNNNGYCFGREGTCVCDKFWEGDNCQTFNDVGVDEESITYIVEEDNDLAPGIVAGIAVACFIIGLVGGALLAGWLTYRYLLRRQKERLQQFQQQLKSRRQDDDLTGMGGDSDDFME